MLHAYLAALIGIALAEVSPGPNLFAVAGAGLGQGLWAALFIVAGTASGTVVYVAAAAVSLGALITLYPAILTGMKVLGGSYLCFLAFKAVKSGLSQAVP